MAVFFHTDWQYNWLVSQHNVFFSNNTWVWHGYFHPRVSFVYHNYAIVAILMKYFQNHYIGQGTFFPTPDSYIGDWNYIIQFRKKLLTVRFDFVFLVMFVLWCLRYLVADKYCDYTVKKECIQVGRTSWS